MKVSNSINEEEFDAAGVELRKETEALLNKYLKGLNETAVDGKFKPLIDALNKINEQQRRDLKNVFEKDLPMEKIRQIDTDLDSNNHLTDNEKGRLRALERELFQYLIKQYELRDDKERMLREIKDILQRIMNPAAHASSIPIYEEELRSALENVKKLKELLNQEAE
ncbi:MAG: hypothetical protein AAF632_28975 [Bacteroidota bacterium]